MGAQKNSPLTEAVFYILLSLYTPLHGYGIMQNVKKLTEGRLNIGAGTLYGALNTLLSKGFISVYSGDDPAKKEYIITQEGKSAVDTEILRLKELVANGEKITGESK
ncbi:MAG: PadR family transcriptional regulator [Oscillospiraceae bacterium]|nr:PadR family transcriptional regulator [Oscillospiraceae bacterium]